MQKTNIKNEFRIVYSMRIAMKLIKMGHKVASTMPNPEEPKYTTWIFENDKTFEADLTALRGGFRNDKR